MQEELLALKKAGLVSTLRTVYSAKESSALSTCVCMTCLWLHWATKTYGQNANNSTDVYVAILCKPHSGKHFVLDFGHILFQNNILVDKSHDMHNFAEVLHVFIHTGSDNMKVHKQCFSFHLHWNLRNGKQNTKITVSLKGTHCLGLVELVYKKCL